MIETVYPEYVQVWLNILDKLISKIYENELSEFAKNVKTYNDVLRLKHNMYERIRPLVDEKCQLVQNCCPTYVVRKEQINDK